MRDALKLQVLGALSAVVFCGSHAALFGGGTLDITYGHLELKSQLALSRKRVTVAGDLNRNRRGIEIQ